ncbi:hypothetical protein [Methylomonas albis]|nr:hypothetical protein [Methylomonas albis]
MFRLTTLLTITLFFSSAVFAHDGGWRNRHRHGYHQDSYGYNYNNPYYQTYVPPPAVGYYRAPANYYGLPPVRGFVYQQPIPIRRCDRNNRHGW